MSFTVSGLPTKTRSTASISGRMDGAEASEVAMTPSVWGVRTSQSRLRLARTTIPCYYRRMNLLLLLPLALRAAAAPAALGPGTDLGSVPIAVSDDGRRLAIVSDEAVTIWDLEAPAPAARIPLPPLPKEDFVYEGRESGAFSPDGTKLALSRPYSIDVSHDRRLYEKILLVDVAQEKVVKTLFKNEGYCSRLKKKTPENEVNLRFCGSAVVTWSFATGGIDRLVFSHDGRKVAFAWPRFKSDVNGEFERRLTVVDLEGKILVDKSLGHYEHDDDSAGFSLAFQPTDGLETRLGAFDGQGRLIGVAADGSTCQSLDLMTGKRVAFLQGCSAARLPSVSLDGRLAVGRDRASSSWKTWSVENGNLLSERAIPAVIEENKQTRADVSLDGRYFFVRAKGAGDAPEIVVHRADSGERILALPDDAFGRVIILGVFGAKGFWVTDDDWKTRFYRLSGAAVAAAARPATAAAPQIDVDEPPKTAAKTDPDAYAVVIGVEKYRQDGVPAVDFAARDAQTMYGYLTGAMGFDPKNVVLLTDDKATKTDLQKNLGSWLKNRATAKSRVFIYYAGHGAPNPTTGEGYLMPYEADPNYLEDTAFPIATLYADVAKLPTKDVTIVLDACFSGQGKRSLVAAGARPLVNVRAAKGPENATVLAAASGAQISATNPERRHGLLTAALLEALHGAADARGDGRITADEVYAFVRPSVERAAKLQNIEQTPTLSAPTSAPARPWIVLPAAKK